MLEAQTAKLRFVGVYAISSADSLFVNSDFDDVSLRIYQLYVVPYLRAPTHRVRQGIDVKLS